MPKVTPAIYNEFIKGLEIAEIRLERLRADFHGADNTFEGDLSIAYKDTKKYEKQKNGEYKISHKYNITFSTEDKGAVFFKFGCTFALVLKTPAELTPGLWRVFKERNLYMNTWPYLRELFQNTITRFNLPPLTLPALKR